MREKILKWFTPFLLSCIAISQIYLVLTSNLTPWKGGGFGMFAYIDRMEHRPVHLTIDNSVNRFIANPAEMMSRDELNRLYSIPGDQRLKRLAEQAMQLDWQVDSTRSAGLDPDLKGKYSEYPVRPFFNDEAEDGQAIIKPVKVDVRIYKLDYDVDSGETVLIKLNESQVTN